MSTRPNFPLEPGQRYMSLAILEQLETSIRWMSEPTLETVIAAQKKQNVFINSDGSRSELTDRINAHLVEVANTQLHRRMILDEIADTLNKEVNPTT